MPIYPIVAVGGIAVVDGSLLLVKRGHPPQEGRWTIPGGKVKYGEQLTHAVEREIQEETSLKVNCGDLVGIAERIDEQNHFVILDFFVSLDISLSSIEGLPVPVPASDAANAAWVPLGDLEEYSLTTGLLEFLSLHNII